MDVLVGVDEKFSSNLTIYPNPAKDEILIKSAEPIRKVSLFNGIGEMVISKAANDVSLSIMVSKFKQGVYYLKIDVEDELVIEKLIIQR